MSVVITSANERPPDAKAIGLRGTKSAYAD